MSVMVLRSSGQVFYEMFFNLSFSDVFLMVRYGLWIFERKIKEIKCHTHHIKLRVYAISMTKHINKSWSPCWGTVCQVFPLYQLYFSYCILWKDVTTYNPLFKGWGIMHHFLEVYVGNYIILNFSAKNICLFSFISFIIQSFISVWSREHFIIQV